MRRSHAFTIPEMLAVTAIIVIILSMLIPTLGKARLSAKRLLCLTRQRSLCVALQGYATANMSLFPMPWASGSDWADAYGLRDDFPYTGATSRSPLGLGLLVSERMLPGETLAETIHCPTLDNLTSAVTGHCMDVAHPWGYGGSGYFSYPNHRIIGGFNYRGTSYWWVNRKPPRRGQVGSNFVMLIDTPDFRMRGEKSQYNAHGGYNIVYADGGGIFLPDRDYVVDGYARTAGGRVDGRGAAANDELLYNYLSKER